MRYLLVIAGLLVVSPAWAQTTIETAVLFPVFMTPTPDGAFHIEHMPLVKIEYGTCLERVAEVEAIMHAVEDDLAGQYGRTGWVHMSRARCYQESFSITLDPTASEVTNPTCLREYALGFDWFGQCP